MKKFFKSEIMRGGVSLFILFNVFNFLGFLYQILMAKTLGPEDYGVLAVLISLFYFVGMPSEIIQTAVSRYTTKFKAKGEYGKIKRILIDFMSNGLIVALAIFIVAMPLFYWYSKFVNVTFSLVVLMALLIFPSFLAPVSRGILQGMKKFNSLGVNMVIEAFVKLVAALILVYFGFRVYGAVVGTLIGAIIGIILSFLPLKRIVLTKREKSKIPNVLSYSSSIFYAMIAIMFIQSIDIILAKRFFSPILAGQYAAANLVGKMIFLGTISIAKVLLPISSEKYENGENSFRAFIKSFFVITLLCTGAVIVIFIFRNLIINIIFSSEYLRVGSILLPLCAAFGLISLSNLVLIYGVSINKTVKAWQLIIFCAIQIGLLYFFSQSLESFSLAMLSTSAILLLGSIFIVFLKGTK